MPRQKYKLGTLVEMRKGEDDKSYGPIVAIVQRTEGTIFYVDKSGTEIEIQEDEILNCYRPIRKRVAKPGKVTRKRRVGLPVAAPTVSA